MNIKKFMATVNSKVPKESKDFYHRATVVDHFEPHLNKNCSILDVGAGKGYSTFAISYCDKTTEVLGINTDDYMHKEALRLRLLLGFDAVDFMIEDIINIRELKPESFDCVLSIGFLKWIDEENSLYKTVKNMSLLCKKDGIIGALEIDGIPRSEREKNYIDILTDRGKHFWKRKEIAESFKNANLEVTVSKNIKYKNEKNYEEIINTYSRILCEKEMKDFMQLYKERLKRYNGWEMPSANVIIGKK